MATAYSPPVKFKRVRARSTVSGMLSFLEPGREFEGQPRRRLSLRAARKAIDPRTSRVINPSNKSLPPWVLEYKCWHESEDHEDNEHVRRNSTTRFVVESGEIQ